MKEEKTYPIDVNPDVWLAEQAWLNSSESSNNNIIKRRAKIKMGSIKENAQAYEPKQTLNITDLEVVKTDLVIKEEVRTKADGEEFTIKTIEVDGKEYRVPDSVLKSLKEILVAKPNLMTFKVSKTGEGLNTSYTVIPLE